MSHPPSGIRFVFGVLLRRFDPYKLLEISVEIILSGEVRTKLT